MTANRAVIAFLLTSLPSLIAQTPNPPANMRATAITPAAIRLAWDAVAQADSYDVLRDEVFVTNVRQLMFTDPTVEAGRLYRYSVKAIPAAGTPSAASMVTVRAMPMEMVPPFLVQCNHQEGDYINLRWVPTPGAASYRIYLQASDGTFMLQGVTSVPSFSAHISGLAEGMSFRFAVVSADQAGNVSSSSSQVVCEI